jgi:uncharacterized protein
MCRENVTLKLDRIHRFEMRGDRLLFHPAKFRVFKIDQHAWDFLDRFDTDGDHSATIPENRHSPEETVSLIEDFRRLGILVPATEKIESEKPAAPPARLRTLVLNISNACNLRCTYCSATQVTSRPALMDRETAERAVDFFLSQTDEGSINFFGGEPLLNFGVIRHTVEYGNARAAETGADLRWGLTTNGTIATEEIIGYLRERRIPVIISIDGYPEAHDAARKFPSGRGSYEIVAKNAREFLAAGLPAVWGRATVSVHNLDVENVVAHIHQLGFQDVTSGCASLVDYSDTTPYGRLLSEGEIQDYRESMIKMAEYVWWAAKTSRPAWVTDLGLYINAIHNVQPRHSACGAGACMIAVSPEGKLYPCSRFDGMPEYELGDVKSGYTRSASFNGDDVSREECHSCWARYLCGGGCWADVLLTRSEEYRRLACRLWKLRVEAALWLYHKLKELPEETLASYCRRVGGDMEERVSRL